MKGLTNLKSSSMEVVILMLLMFINSIVSAPLNQKETQMEAK
jgi:hypothetical protein